MEGTGRLSEYAGGVQLHCNDFRIDCIYEVELLLSFLGLRSRFVESTG